MIRKDTMNKAMRKRFKIGMKVVVANASRDVQKCLPVQLQFRLTTTSH